MEQAILIRPLHFVDILCDCGGGKDILAPHPFGHALHLFAGRILSDKDTLLEITLEPDFVCKPCLHNLRGECDNVIDTSFRPTAPPLMRDWDLLINRRWCRRLNITEGERYTARRLCERVRDRAGDITEIFPEFIDNRAEIKAKNLREGIRKFLEPEPRE